MILHPFSTVEYIVSVRASYLTDINQHSHTPERPPSASELTGQLADVGRAAIPKGRHSLLGG